MFLDNLITTFSVMSFIAGVMLCICIPLHVAIFEWFEGHKYMILIRVLCVIACLAVGGLLMAIGNTYGPKLPHPRTEQP